MTAKRGRQKNEVKSHSSAEGKGDGELTEDCEVTVTMTIMLVRGDNCERD